MDLPLRTHKRSPALLSLRAVADTGVVRIVEDSNHTEKPSILEKIKANKWEMNFQGKWSLYECCYYGKHITETLRKTYTTGPLESIFIFREGVATHYLVPAQIENLNAILREKVMSDIYVIDSWIDDVENLILEIRSLFANLQNIEVSLSDLDSTWEILGRYYVANFPFKKLLDSMDQSFQEQWIQRFSEIRTSGEFIYGEYPAIITKVLTSLDIVNTPEAISYALPEEIERAVSTATRLDQSELDERMHKSALVFIHGKRYLFKGESVDAIEKSIIDTTSREGSDMMKGTVAYPGRAQGVVKVVLNPSVVTSYPQNAVLVTGMTRPEYLPLIRKSVGIITDAGGILSHAAISARELKIPCIIGTKIATQVLRDGDLVEVDAESGVVRIIERK